MDKIVLTINGAPNTALNLYDKAGIEDVLEVEVRQK